jgi:hypothetical protein
MMGQQQIAAEQASGALRRMMLVVLVAAFVALIMTVTAAPALAAPREGSFELGAKIAANQDNDNNALKGGLKAEANHLKSN